MITRLMLGVLALATFFAVGCDEGSNSGNANLNGMWDFTVTATGGQQLPSGTEFCLVLSLSQSGTDVSGYYVRNSVRTEVSGRVSGSAVTFTFSQADGCLGVFNGGATVHSSGDRLEGHYSGSDCNGTLQASFVAYPRSYPRPVGLAAGGGIILDGGPCF